MKKFIISLLFSFSSLMFSQGNDQSKNIKMFKYSVSGGINFETISEVGGTFNFGVNLKVLQNTDIRLLLGYSRIFEQFDYNVKTNSEATINNQKVYYATTYDVVKKGYDTFPVSIGLQYFFDYKIFTPFITIDVSYNIISTDIIKSPGFTWNYSTFDELPEEFKIRHTEVYPKNSIGSTFGLGVHYHLTPVFDLALSYQYKIDSEINNTHYISAGILF
jgi:hypothetical protein